MTKAQEALEILKNYQGDNHYIIYLKNGVFAYQNITLNDMQVDFIRQNKDFSPRYINRIIRITDWYGENRQKAWNIEFTPEKLLMTWYMGETETLYVFYCIYRRSQEKAVMCFAPKNAVVTDFLTEPYQNFKVDFEKYDGVGGRWLKPHQRLGVQFLCARQRCILADEPGAGKTTQAIVAALESDYKHILIMCPASVKETWKRELSIYIPEEDSEIVAGKKWKDSRFTIINYDILKNFYEIPTETRKFRQTDVDADGNLKAVYKEKTVVSRRKAVVEAAMEDSQLFQSRFDLIIIDEAHKLSNNTSQRFKIVNDLITRSNPRGIFAVTGTPITNRPMNLYNLLRIIGSPVARDWRAYVERYCDGTFFYNKTERNAYTQNFLKKKGVASWYALSPEQKDELNEILDKYCKKMWKTDGASHMDELRERIKNCYLRREKDEFDNMVTKTVKVLKYRLNSADRAEYEKVWDEYRQKRLDKAKEEGTSINDDEILESIDDSKLLIEGMILRQWISKKMIPYTASIVRKCISNGEKVVVFCSFDDELYTLQELFKDCCVIHNGKLTKKKKDKAVDEFQNNPDIKVFIGNINSAGVGITLTAANNCVFNSFSWVSGDNLQAMDRVHRLSQDKPVNCYIQVIKDSVYETMWKKVCDKQAVVEEIIVSENAKLQTK